MRLGAVQPGEQVAVFNDALSQLSDRLTYLYRQDRRYWYDTRPNLRRTVAERAQQFAEDDVEREIERRVREAVRRERGDFRGVHPCPASSADVPDEPAVRLVVFGPGAPHADRNVDSAARTAARDLLSRRGDQPRRHQNMLAFLAPDREVVEGLEHEARRFLAWKSVVRDHEALTLDAHQRREAAEGEKASDDTVRLRLHEAWRWLLVPVQHAADGGVGGLEWDVAQVAGGVGDAPVALVWQRMRSNEHVVARWSPALLKMELDRWFWKDRRHVPVKQVWDALCAYCYLPRLLEESVFTTSIRAGVESGEYFGYATSVSAQGRYEGLAFGSLADVYVDSSSVLVKPEAARAQIEAERPVSEEKEAGTGPLPPSPVDPEPPVAKPRLARRFFGTARLDPLRAGRDMSIVAEEVVQHLDALPGAELEVSVDISAIVPAGISENVRRIVDENCKTLRFRSHGFEEE